MAAVYGVRLTSCGPNRLAVLARVRSLVRQPPAAVKAAVDSGRPVVVAAEVGRSAAEELVAMVRRPGATAEIFETIPCPSVGDG